MPWFLEVETRTEKHSIRLTDDENEAVGALNDARAKMDMRDVVIIRDRLAVRADDIVSIRLQRRT